MKLQWKELKDWLTAEIAQMEKCLNYLNDHGRNTKAKYELVLAKMVELELRPPPA